MFHRTRANHADSGVLVMAVMQMPIEEEIWVWDLLSRVRPQLCELIAMTDTSLACPEFGKTLAHHLQLDKLCENRERLVLVAKAPAEEPHRELVRWQAEQLARPAKRAPQPHPWKATPVPEGLTAVRRRIPASAVGKAPLLPFWLESTLPQTGLDYIQLPWPRVAPGHPVQESVSTTPLVPWESPGESLQFVGPHAPSLRVMASALLGTLWEIVREVSARAAIRPVRAA
ncbi:MAG: hypothetical protein KBD56_04845 [Candidatus Eisenbacteria bacterium]|nr:hypothetical protein [Candidatus Eisenbacteria bacterium]